MPAKTLYPLEGIVPIINTPFDEELRIDFASIERLVEQGIADGITGCIVPAVASEVEKLTAEERRSLVERVAAAAKGRIPVFAGCSSEDLDQSRELASHAVKAGALECCVAFLPAWTARTKRSSSSSPAWQARRGTC